MVTQIVSGRVYDFSHVVGRAAASGTGFTQPIAVTVASEDVVYVLNRGWEMITAVEWNRTSVGIRVTKLTVGTVPGDEELVSEFSKTGDGPGELIWPAGMALDSQEKLYVTDEWLNRVSSFDKEDNFLNMWGKPGQGDGEFNCPSGMAIDQQDDLYIVDSRNHRVQKFTRDGRFLAKWGSFGMDDGQFNSPWGITIDQQGYVYVADHKNHRVQKFTSVGELVDTFGSHGTGRGELNRPTDVAVDPDGDIYVCDWANHRVQVFGSDGRFLVSLLGDARELSKWAKMSVDASPETIKRRREVRDPEVEWRFDYPTAVTFDAIHSRLIVADTHRGRLQIYNKLKDYVQPARNI